MEKLRKEALRKELQKEALDEFSLVLDSLFNYSGKVAKGAKGPREKVDMILMKLMLKWLGENKSQSARAIRIAPRTFRHKLEQYREEGLEFFEDVKVGRFPNV